MTDKMSPRRETKKYKWFVILTRRSIFLGLCFCCLPAMADTFEIIKPNGVQVLRMIGLPGWVGNGRIELFNGHVVRGTSAQLTPDPLVPEFIVKNGAGNVVALLGSELPDRHLYIAGEKYEDVTVLAESGGTSELIFKDPAGNVIALIDEFGNLKTLGTVEPQVIIIDPGHGGTDPGALGLTVSTRRI